MPAIRSMKSLLIGVVSLIIIAGCQPGSSTNPVAPSGSDETLVAKVRPGQILSGSEEASRVSVLFPVRGLLGGLTQTVTGLVTPLLGGILNISNSSLRIPPLAVLFPTMVRFSMITATPQGLPGALDRLYDFSPEGLNFLVPTTLYVSFSDAGIHSEDPYAYTFYYFNAGQNRWEPQATQVDMQNHRFVVTLHHFSRYAFGR